MEAFDDNKRKSLPDTYEIPGVWDWSVARPASLLSGHDRPTSGPRKERSLPVGKHALQVYTRGTENGSKVTILLEEIHDLTGLEYDGWKISFVDDDHYGSEFVKMNPNSKIPILVDRELDPPLRVFESCNIMRYVAEKSNFFMPTDPRRKVECLNWLFWSHAAAAVFSNFAYYFTTAPVCIQYVVNYWTVQLKRLLAVLDSQLAERRYVCDDEYTIADMSIFPMIRGLDKFYKAGSFLQLHAYSNINIWFKRIDARAAVRRGIRVAGFGFEAIKDRHCKADFILR